MTGALIDRDQYAALAHGVYLNQASLGLIPRAAIDTSTPFANLWGGRWWANNFVWIAGAIAYGRARRSPRSSRASSIEPATLSRE